MAEVRANPGVPVLAQFGGSGAPTMCAPVVVDSTTGYVYTLIPSSGTVVAAGRGGTVTSVGASFTGGLVSVAGSPVTTSGTLALTVAGTSGGVPYFSGASTWASSAALAANALVLGGGAGAAPATLGSTGTTTTVLHGNAGGAPTFGAVSLTADVTGTLPVANGGTGVTSSSGTGSAFALVTTHTWTPTVRGSSTAGTQTYSAQVGVGTQIADCFFYSVTIVMTAKDATTAGVVQIAGFPLTSRNTSNLTPAGAVTAARFDLDAGYTQVAATMNSNSTVMNVGEIGDNVAFSNLVAANLLANSQITVTGHYFV